MADKPCESINFQIVQIEISKEKICPFRVGGAPNRMEAASRSRGDEKRDRLPVLSQQQLACSNLAASVVICSSVMALNHSN